MKRKNISKIIKSIIIANKKNTKTSNQIVNSNANEEVCPGLVEYNSKDIA